MVLQIASQLLFNNYCFIHMSRRCARVIGQPQGISQAGANLVSFDAAATWMTRCPEATQSGRSRKFARRFGSQYNCF